MPKDEFDFEDPLELNGVALLTHEDTTNDMAECFIEEFMRMGYGHKQILALFRNPQYLGPHLAFEKRGEPFVRDTITEVFARWGRSAAWTGSSENPLTPTLSPSEGEREDCPPSNPEPVTAEMRSAKEISDGRSSLFPLPRGGGEGQGERVDGVNLAAAPPPAFESAGALTDPMGAPIPILNL